LTYGLYLVVAGPCEDYNAMSNGDDSTEPTRGAERQRETLRAGAMSEAFFADRQERAKHGMPTGDDEPMYVVVELNLFHENGLTGSRERLQALSKEFDLDEKALVHIADTYVRCRLTINQTKKLVRLDQDKVPVQERAIYRVWPDFTMNLLIDRSIATIKADAARRSFDATGHDIVWAVIDSGIQGTHPHFKTYDTLGGSVSKLHRDFTQDDPRSGKPLEDDYGHGTHVAGIIAGSLLTPGQMALGPGIELRVGQRVAVSSDSVIDSVVPRENVDVTRLAGVAPRCKLISLKVLSENGKRIRSTDVLRALEYVRVELNGHGKPPLRVQGVNISLGYEFNARWFACGQSPVCIEVDRLVRTGVAVVISAGNTGYGDLTTKDGLTSTGLALTINDPGNAALAITVGATHRDSPHTYGVSFFSSKGPTGDGRLKPDLVAPGERITSCAAGKHLAALKRAYPNETQQAWESADLASYIDHSGTSMAAPHVSGAIAAFLSIRREFIGRPDEVKRIFLEGATSLGRDRYFEGHGLVDLMRAVQSV
jgi:serine protease AprX